MSKRPLSGGKLPKKPRKLTPTEVLTMQRDEARKDATNLKTAIGEMADLMLMEVRDVKEYVEDLDGHADDLFENLTKMINGLKAASEVTIA